MKKLLVLIILSLNFPVFSQHWEWVKQPANTGSGDLRLAIGTNGFTFLSSSSYNLSNQYNAHLIKQLNGNTVWDKNFGKNMQIKGLATNSAGAVFLSGNFKDTILINGTQLISAGLTDAFLFKLDSAGQTLWLKTFSSPDEDICNDAYLDYSGNILVTGALSNNAIVEGTTYPTKGLFIAKFNSNGTLLNIIRSTNGGQGLRIKSDSLNNLYMMGVASTDTLLLDTVTVYPPYYMAPSNFVAKFDLAGSYKGFVAIGKGTSYEVEPSGNFYVADYVSSYSGSWISYYNSNCIKLWQKTNLGSASICMNSKKEIYSTGSYLNYSDTTHSFLWKYDRNGNVINNITTLPHQQINGTIIKMDEQENIYIVGNCLQSTDFGAIHLNLNPGQYYFMAKIKGKKPYAGFTFTQPYEAQSIHFKNRCLNDTAVRWIFPGANPSVSTEKNPVAIYPTAGQKTAILIAFNGFSSDTMIRQFIVKPEPTDTIYTKKIATPFNMGGYFLLHNTTSDGGFVIGSPGICKFNRRGNMEWMTSSAFASSPWAERLTEIKDGYITLSSSVNYVSSSFTTNRPAVIKTDKSGQLIWSKDYTDPHWPLGSSAVGLCTSYEGGFIFSGTATVKHDYIGNIIWQKTYPFSSTNIAQHTAGNYILHGSINNSNNYCVSQIKGDGTLNWIKGYTNIGFPYLFNTVCNNKDIVIVGTNNAASPAESYAVRLDSAGNIKWAKTYIAGECSLSGVVDVGDGKLMMCGEVGYTSNTRQMVVILLDQNGNPVWNRLPDTSSISYIYSLISHGDGHAFLFWSKSPDYFLSRINLSPPPCLSDTINIITSTRTVSIVNVSTANIDTMHYTTTNISFYNSGFFTPSLPAIQCTTSGVVTDVLPSGIIENDEIIVFPNPTSGLFTINKLTAGKSGICVYDVLGNCVLNKTELTNNQEIDLSKHAKGIYFVEISSGNEKVVKKISLQ